MVQIDISMPQSCDECPFLLVDYKTNVPDCDLMEDLPNCPEYDWNTPMGQRDKNCPLREVPKGKWINAKCSACGNLAPFWPMASTYYHTNYCPHCGADMGEEPKGLDG